MLGTKAKPKPVSDKNHAPSSNLNGEKGTTCVVAKGTNIEGNFFSKENVRLDGFISGEVKCENRLVMGETGKIIGIIHTQDAVIMGKVEGQLFVRGTLHLKSTAKIQGIINAKFLVVDEGAQYIGECEVGEKKHSNNKVLVGSK